MTPAISAVFAQAPLPTLLVIGLAILFGTIGAKIFQRLHIPQVVGYIVIGLLLGRSGLEVIGTEAIKAMRPFSFFALGLIGFIVGGELRLQLFRKYGKSFIVTLVSEGMGAFFGVSALCFIVLFLLTGNIRMSVAVGIVLGAISAATDPAATMNVLWEYKTRGILTTTATAMVALDDGLALMLYAVVASVAGALIGTGGAGSGGFLHSLWEPVRDLVGAGLLGAGGGWLLNFIVRRVRGGENILPFILGSLVIVIGVARATSVDLILSTMVLGITLVNLAPRRSKEAFDVIKSIAPPIYVLFFVIVGARLHISNMTAWMWALSGAYILGRSIGKITGAKVGVRLTGGAQVLRKYLGWCLFSQAGVAVGLSIIAADHLTGKIDGTIGLGEAIIMIITVTTFVVTLLGPPFVKLAVKKAGEIGLNVTEKDLMQTYNASEMMEKDCPTFMENTPVSDILHTIAEIDAMSYPVTDADGKLIGIITLEDLKGSFGAEDLANWLVAFDLMEPVPDTVAADMPLVDAVARMNELKLEYLPVVAAEGDTHLAGMLELVAINRSLLREVVRRQQLADGPIEE